jgi:hypothetical protein
MKTTREFAPADRYRYDFGPCSYERGFAQIDTAQDAPYFGTWCSPSRLMIVSYCEGDVTIQECESAEEFAAELCRIDEWNVAQGHGHARIDPGLDPAFRLEFEALGLTDLLH